MEAEDWQLSPLFTHSPMPQAIADRDGRFVAVNPACCALFDSAEGELLGTPFMDLTHPADLEENRTLWKGLQDGDRRAFTFDKRVVTKGGAARWVRVHVTAVPGEGNASWRAHACLESRQREHELAIELERARALVAELGEGLEETVVQLSFDGEVRWASPAARRFLGDTVNEQYAGVFQIAHPEEAETVRSALGAVLRDREPGHGELFRFRAVLGRQTRHLQGRFSIGTQGQTLLLHLQDRTEQVQAEALLTGEMRLLRAMAKGIPTETLLAQLADLVETLDTSARCAVLTLDRAEHKLRYAAAPSLPNEYLEATEDLPALPAAGSVGTTVERGRPVVVEDVETHPLWRQHRAQARAAGIRASWSVPVLGPGDGVVGVVVVYRQTPGEPNEAQWWLIHRAALIAGGLLAAGRETAPAGPAPEGLDRLTPREWQVLRLVALGHTNAEIAQRLDVSVRTVEAQRAGVARKLRATTRADLVSAAIAGGLVP